MASRPVCSSYTEASDRIGTPARLHDDTNRAMSSESTARRSTASVVAGGSGRSGTTPAGSSTPTTLA